MYKNVIVIVINYMSNVIDFYNYLWITSNFEISKN